MRHEEYLHILTSRYYQANPKRARKAVEALCDFGEVGWRVIGVTKDALALWQEQGRVGGGKIKRGHIEDRCITYKHLVDSPIYDAHEWWQYAFSHDKTILVTAKENRKNRVLSRTTYWHPEHLALEGMWRGQSVGCKWDKAEDALLQALV